MKKIIIKLFLFLCALIFISEGAILLMAYFGWFSVDEATAFYSLLLQTSGWLDILYGVAAAFLCLGLVLLLNIFRKTGPIKTIEVQDKGEMVRIPVKTLKDFIEQIIRMNGRFNDVYIGVKKKGKWIYIDVAGTYTGQSPIHHEITEVKKVLKGEIKRVFEFSHLRIDFQIDGVHADFWEKNDLREENNEIFSAERGMEETNSETDSPGESGQFQEHHERIIKEAAQTKKIKSKLPWKQ